jgi:FG-GAP-like repeat
MTKQHCLLSSGSLRFGLIVLLLGVLSSAAPPVRATAPFTDSGAQFLPATGDITAWGDYDNDGDLDLVLGGQMNTGNNVFANFMKLYRNEGGIFADSGAALPGIIGGAAEWGDYDNDGDVDLLVVGSYLLRIYRNDGGSLVDSGVGLDGMESAAAAWGDYDNDGDLDFVVGGWAFGRFITAIYRNNHGAFVDSGIVLPGVVRGSFAWGDYDNDGDLDLFMMGYAGNAILITRIYRNDGGTFADSAAALPMIQDGSGAWGDYDNDGDLDLLLTGDRQYELIARVYRNDQGQFVNIGAVLPGIVGLGRWVDYDNDGDLDLHLSGTNYTSLINDLYRNDNGNFAAVNAGLPSYTRAGSVWGDYDDDGRLDLATLDRLPDDSYVDRVYHNNTDVVNMAPSVPSGLTASTDAAAATLSWDAASDDHTLQQGLAYNLRVGTAPGGTDVVAPMALAGGKRQVVQIGNTNLRRSWTIRHLTPGQTYYWSIQAVDTAYAGSAFAEEHSFVAGADTPIPTPTAPAPTPPPPAACSISINNGEVYVGRRQVHLWMNVPGAVQMQVSNDGGFAGATWQAYDAHFDWTLRDPGPRIVTLVAYARFADANGGLLCGGANISDDIIYDPLPPDVSISVASAPTTGASHIAVTNQAMLLIDAADQDGGSGIAEMRVGTQGTFDQAGWQPFTSAVQIAAQPGETLLVQIRDRVGNASRTASATMPGSSTTYLPMIQR